MLPKCFYRFCFYAFLSQFILFCVTDKSSHASVVKLAQVPNDTSKISIPSPQNIQPRLNPSFDVPSVPESQKNPLSVTDTTSPDAKKVPDGGITVTDLEFTGNTVFSTEELRKESKDIPPRENKHISFAELIQIAAEVTALYHEKGYKTSGAIVYIPKQTQEDGKGRV